MTLLFEKSLPMLFLYTTKAPWLVMSRGVLSQMDSSLTLKFLL